MRVPTDLSTDEKTEAIRKLYDLLPDVECKGLCATTCTDIDMSSHERWLIEHRHGVKIRSRDHVEIQRKGPKRCRALKTNNHCGVYEDRPLICRAFGSVAAMPCPYGCEPSRQMSDEEYEAIQILVEDIGGHHMRTPEDRRQMLRNLNTPAGRAALKRQYDKVRADLTRLAGTGDDDANFDWSNLRRESLDE